MSFVTLTPELQSIAVKHGKYDYANSTHQVRLETIEAGGPYDWMISNDEERIAIINKHKTETKYFQFGLTNRVREELVKHFGELPPAETCFINMSQSEKTAYIKSGKDNYLWSACDEKQKQLLLNKDIDKLVYQQDPNSNGASESVLRLKIKFRNDQYLKKSSSTTFNKVVEINGTITKVLVYRNPNIYGDLFCLCSELPFEECAKHFWSCTQLKDKISYLNHMAAECIYRFETSDEETQDILYKCFGETIKGNLEHAKNPSKYIDTKKKNITYCWKNLSEDRKRLVIDVLGKDTKYEFGNSLDTTIRLLELFGDNLIYKWRDLAPQEKELMIRIKGKECGATSYSLEPPEVIVKLMETFGQELSDEQDWEKIDFSKFSLTLTKKLPSWYIDKYHSIGHAVQTPAKEKYLIDRYRGDVNYSMNYMKKSVFSYLVKYLPETGSNHL